MMAAFLIALAAHHTRSPLRASGAARITMLRNIDGIELLLVATTLDAQVARLADEALGEGAAVAIGEWLDGSDALALALRTRQPPERVRLIGRSLSFTQARLALSIQPSGFGGSDGFGSKPREQARPPLPERTVVLADECAACIEAMESGMRSVGVARAGWGADAIREMDRLADVLLDDLDGVYATDLATPGAFWLNPPLPRTEDGTFLPDPDVHVAPCRLRRADAASPRQDSTESLAPAPGCDRAPSLAAASSDTIDGDGDGDDLLVTDGLRSLSF